MGLRLVIIIGPRGVILLFDHTQMEPLLHELLTFLKWAQEER